MSQEIGFLAQFQVFFKNKIKTITCLMHYVALHHWSKFQRNLTTCQWVTSKKSPRSSLKLYLLLKTFEISKLENYKSDINETWPRHVTAEYLQFNKIEGVNEWAGGGATKKATRECYEIKRNLTLTFKTSLENATEIWIFHCHP